jgi:glycosyltransferase involved in cell wall biosynthesis
VIRVVGVVVPAHNEQRLLPACLASLRRAAQALPGLPVHLIVVADACRDQTAEVARRGGAAVVRISERNVGAARAAGVREVLRRTTGQDPAHVWVATTDADTSVSARWLRQQVRYGNQGWDAVAGTVRVADWSGYRPEVPSLFRDRYGTERGPHPHVHGANLGFRAAAYLRAGGFPDLPTAEDHALVAALSASGSRIRRTRALAVVTSARRESRAPHGFGHYLAELDASALAPWSPGIGRDDLAEFCRLYSSR